MVSAPGPGGGWLVTAGPTTLDDSYRGEVFDARLATLGWDHAGFRPPLCAAPGAGGAAALAGCWRHAEAVAVPPGSVPSYD